MLGVVRAARKYIVLDYFLFNSQLGTAAGAGPAYRQLSGELRDALIERRRELPPLRSIVHVAALRRVLNHDHDRAGFTRRARNAIDPFDAAGNVVRHGIARTQDLLNVDDEKCGGHTRELSPYL